MKILIRQLLTLVLVMVVAMASAQAEDDEKSGRKPPTQKTEKLSPAVYKELEKAQTALEEQQPQTALAILDKLLSEKKLNDYEKAQAYNFYAAVHYEANDLDATIEDYKKILKLEKAPQQVKDNALFRLAQLYFVKEDYALSIKLLDKWTAGVESVSPDAYMLKAQAYYQLENFEGARDTALLALREARKRKQTLKENWLSLLRAAYYETGNYAAAVSVLEWLIKAYPKPSYYQQLSGMYGLQGKQQEQLYVMHAAYASGMLQSEGELLNMARLYMAEGAPAPAIELLEQAMQQGNVDADKPDNLQLLGQAMALGHEYGAQIGVLQKLAAKTGKAEHYLYLGQAQIALNRWDDAAASLRQALAAGEIDDRGNVLIQLGMALFNADELKPARRVFIDASAYDSVADTASNWVKYVDSELQRQQAMQN